MLSRRALLTTAAAATALSVARPAAAHVFGPERKIFLANPHTGETFHDIYWAEGDYIFEALKQLDVLLRDHHNDKITVMDPELIDLLAGLRRKLGIAQPIQVISAYRSRETNAALRRRNRHVARNSLHMEGKAVDIRVPSFNLAKLRRAAVALQAGGVGSYANANFIHLDVGPVRVW